jgi:hypothetical protein
MRDVSHFTGALQLARHVPPIHPTHQCQPAEWAPEGDSSLSISESALVVAF